MYDDYGVWGVRFYNKSRNTKEKDFENDMKKLLYNDDNKLTENIVRATLNKKIAAHVNIGVMISKIKDDKSMS